MIVLYMQGGMSQIDTLDPKPGRPTGGSFKAIDTSASGIRFAEHLPRLAEQARHLTVVRSLVAREGNHLRARYLMHTGYSPQGGVEHPGLGSHVARARSPDSGAAGRDVPGFVSIGRVVHGAGYLGPTHAPFMVRRASQPVRNLSPAAGLDDARIDRRRTVLDELDRGFAQRHPTPAARGGAAVRAQAEAIMQGRAAAAFDLTREHGNALERYGGGEFGRGCLMARRLIDAGVPFVEVSLGGWDTHEDNFDRVASLSALLDRGMSALIDDLRASGRWAHTSVVCLGDFGRTPVINARGGRDHYPAAASALLGGGGLASGRVVGATDPDGHAVIERPVRIPDLFHTFAHVLRVDPAETHVTPQGRPVTTLDPTGAVVPELLA